MSNVQSYVPMVGVDMLHYAKVKTDTLTSYETETPVAVPGVTEIGFNQNGSVRMTFNCRFFLIFFW